MSEAELSQRTYVSTRELCDLFGVQQTKTIRRLVTSGGLKAVKVGGRLRVIKASLDDYLAKNAVPAGEGA
jgi:excisionase family DNA binding protein